MNIDSKPASPPVGGGIPSVGPQNTGHAPAQERENADPSERVQPMPLLAAAVTLVMVLFGAGSYVGRPTHGGGPSRCKARRARRTHGSSRWQGDF